MRRGEVYWIALHPRSGSEQRGHRPAVVVSHDAFNQHDRWRSIIVVPLSTSRRQLRSGASAVVIKAGETGLREDSVALCHQVTTMNRGKVGALAGTLSSDAVQRLNGGLMAALDLLA